MVENVIYIVLFMVICTAISLTVQYILDRNRHREIISIEYLRRAVFYLLFFYFALSAIKYIIGLVNGTATQIETVFESFYDLELMTFVHYGPVFFVLSVLMPVCIIIFHISDKYINIYNTYCAIVIFALLVCKGKVDNRNFTWMFIVGAVISLFATIAYKDNLDYIKKYQVKQYLRELLPIIFCWVFMNGIFVPNELFLNNTVDFTNPYGSFISSLIIGAAFFIVVIMTLSLFLLPIRVFKIFRLTMFAITLLNYIQYMFLNQGLRILDGEEKAWSTSTFISNTIWWIALMTIVITLGLRLKKSAVIMNTVCIYICLIQVVTMGYLTITTKDKPSSYESGFTNVNALEISKGNNIFVFVLDRFDSKCFQQIIEQDSSFMEPLADFTFYSDTVAPFMHTSTGIPFLLTGIEWQKDMYQESQYIEYAYENGTMLEDLYGADYDIGIFTDSQYVTNDKYEYISNYNAKIKKKTNLLETIDTMWKASFYTTMPYTVKMSYLYYYAGIGGMVDSENKWIASNDLSFYQLLTQKGLSINDSYENTYRFYHMWGIHAPYVLSEDIKSDRKVDMYSQGKGCLKIVYEYLQQLKELGKYDDATIIITADHGYGMSYGDDFLTIPNTSEPLLLVKEAKHHNEVMMENLLPVTQAGIIPTVMNAAGIKDDKYGQSLDTMNITGKRICMNSYGFVIQYAINGKVTDIDNWSIENIYFPEEMK